MKASVLVRIASVLALLHALLHTLGGVLGKVSPGPEAVAAAAMKVNHFMAFGQERTFWDFYTGMGLGVTIALTMEGVVLWLLAPVATKHPRELRPVLAAFAVGYLVFAVNSFRYFFLGPVIAEVLIAMALLGAIAIMGNRRERLAAQEEVFR